MPSTTPPNLKPHVSSEKRGGKNAIPFTFRSQTNVAVSRWKRKRGNEPQHTVFWEWNGNGWPSDVTVCVCVWLLYQKVSWSGDWHWSWKSGWPRQCIRSEKLTAASRGPDLRAEPRERKHELDVQLNTEGRCEDLTALCIFSTLA